MQLGGAVDFSDLAGSGSDARRGRMLSFREGQLPPFRPSRFERPDLDAGG